MGTKLTESFLKKLIPYIVASCLALLSAFLLLKLWLADWRIQFFYTGDAMFYNMMVKGIIENGWYLYNKNLGMPFGATLYDFPAPDTFTFLLFKFLAIFTSDQSLIINIFYIATFPLTTITSLYVLRHFKISFFPALLSSLLYAFLTYHLSRAEIHLMYTVYFIVPLIVMVILWVCAAGSKKDNDEGEQLRLSLKNRKFISSLVICALIASTGGVYYSFFACFLLVAVGIIQASAFRQLRKLLLPGVLTAFTFLVLAANLSPNIIYQMKNGKTETAQRNPIEAEIYGLKLAQLVLPQTGHRWITFRRPKAKYNFAPLVNENDDATLGVIGTIGFMTLLGWLVCNVFNKGREENQTQILLGQLSVLNFTAFLLGTIGGFSVIFALFVSPQIRSYNRISIYIAFFSLFAVGLLLDRTREKFFHKGWPRIAFSAMVIILTILGLLDQSSTRLIPDYAGVKKEYENDADLVRRIEASVPAGAMIFQLPVKRYPETPPIERVFDYDLLKGYIHSKQLRWSYGAVRGRIGDAWQSSLVKKPLPEMIETLVIVGFEGLYIDRFGYADNAAKLESDLTALLKVEPLISLDKRQSFFNLSTYRTLLSEKYSPEELANKRKALFYPFQPLWERGCSGLETGAGEEWRWCGQSAELVINNHAPYPRRVTMEMSLETAAKGEIRIESPFFNEEELTMNPKQVIPFSKTFEIPAGKHSFKFTSTAPRVFAPYDPRVFVFRVINLNLKNAD